MCCDRDPTTSSITCLLSFTVAPSTRPRALRAGLSACPPALQIVGDSIRQRQRWDDESGVRYRGATTFSKLGVQCLGLGYCTEQNTDDIPSFVHCSLQLRKKLGWSVQILGRSGPSRPPSGWRPWCDSGIDIAISEVGERERERASDCRYTDTAHRCCCCCCCS